MRNEALLLKDIIGQASDIIDCVYNSECYIHGVLCEAANELSKNGNKELSNNIIGCVCYIIESYNRLREIRKQLDDWKFRDDRRLTDIESLRRSMLKEIYDITSDKSKQLSDLESDVNELSDRIDTVICCMTSDKSKQLSDLESDVNELSDRIDTVLSLVDENAKVLAVSKNMRKPHSMAGENNPRYRVDIPMDELIDKYKRGVTVKELSKIYGMSEPGIMHRLKQVGVYKRKNNKYAK